MLGKKRVKIVVKSRIDHGTYDGVFTYGPGLHEVDEDLADEWLEGQLAVRYVEGSEAKPGLPSPPLPTLPDDPTLLGCRMDALKEQLRNYEQEMRRGPYPEQRVAYQKQIRWLSEEIRRVAERQRELANAIRQAETRPERAKAPRQKRTPLKSNHTPNKERCRLYRMIHRAKLLDLQTGLLKRATTSDSQQDVYDTIFSETFSREPVLKTCNWEITGVGFPTIGAAWESQQSAIRRRMKVWVRKLIADCAPHREEILRKPAKK